MFYPRLVCVTFVVGQVALAPFPSSTSVSPVDIPTLVQLYSAVTKRSGPRFGTFKETNPFPDIGEALIGDCWIFLLK
jgi:hypothetical protein